jgi:hypothetical protein
MGIDVKSKMAKLTAKLRTSVGIKSRKSILTEKLHTVWSFGVNSTTQREVVLFIALNKRF